MIKRILLGLVIVLVILAGLTWLNLSNAAKGIEPAELEARYMTEADRFVVVDGARVRVREEGPEGAPAIVLIHGFTHSLETWDAWADALKGESRVIRYDLLGHGLTGPDPAQRYSPAERAAFLGELLDALDVDSAVLAGNSLGGTIAWRFAALEPDRVEALVLVDPGLYDVAGVEDAPAEPPAPVAFFLRYSPRFMMTPFIFADPEAVPAERVEEMQAMMRRRGNNQAFFDHLAEFTLPDPSAILAGLDAPVLLIWGEEDRLFPVEHGERAAATLPNAELVVIPGAGHAPHEEAPEASLAALRAFLAEN